MKKKLYQKSWNSLSPKQKALREKSLKVLSKARRTNKSLSKISSENKIPVKTVLNHTNAFRKINNRWIPKKFDRISRVLDIKESGKEISIETRDSRTASKIGKYHNAVKHFLDSGDATQLKKFEGKSIIDAQGKSHVFETDLDQIISIEERKEEPEIREFYDS